VIYHIVSVKEFYDFYSLLGWVIEPVLDLIDENCYSLFPFGLSGLGDLHHTQLVEFPTGFYLVARLVYVIVGVKSDEYYGAVLKILG